MRGARLLCLLLVFACGDDDFLPIGDAGPRDVGRDSPAIDAPPVDAPAPPDAVDAVGAADTGPDAPPPPRCPDDTHAPRAFQMGDGDAYGEIAGDFRVTEFGGGTFVFAEAFTGCDSYVFINHTGNDASRQIFNGFVDQLLESSAPNVHYFFTSYERDDAARDVILTAMRASIDETLNRIGAMRGHWAPRLHVVAEAIQGAEGSLGAFVRAVGQFQQAFAIDRAQRFDPVGSLSVVAAGGFVSRLPMAGYASHYFNYKAALEERVAAEDAAGTVTTTLLDAEGVTEREHTLMATLPDGIGSQGLDVDVRIFCHEDPAGCSEWDRIAHLYVCRDEACDERDELVRWITPYSRPGERRWVIDASSRAGLLRPGAATFRLVLGPTWEEATPRDVRVTLRSHPDATGATTVMPLFTGGNFDASYNDARTPATITAPATASKVELVVIVSGHGQTDGDNCAEWCNHVHRFGLGAETFEISFPSGIGTPLGCAERVGEGVVPGQYGNWAPLRAGWCPGEPVHPHVFDVTDAVDLGADNSVRYEALFAGGAPRGGTISLSSYLVFYE